MHRKVGFFLSSIALGFIVLVWAIVPNPAFSHHKSQVLGDSTTSSQIVFPPVTAGAGFILPDSPLYFMDEMFQNVRLLLAFTPERRASIRASIANERLAELRIMFSRNNSNGIAIALSKLTQEVKKISANLSDAASSGKDLSLLAKELNDTVNTQREVLGTLENQADGVLKLQLKTARNALKIAKVEIEDNLSKDEFDNEIENDVDDEINEAVDEASGSAKKLGHAVDVLTRLASEAAVKQQTRREEALRHAIEVKNEALKKQQEKQLSEESRKQKRILEMRTKAHEKAREAIEKVHEAVSEFKEANEDVEELRNQNGEDSGSSGSGSESSGSGKSESNDDGR